MVQLMNGQIVFRALFKILFRVLDRDLGGLVQPHSFDWRARPVRERKVGDCVAHLQAKGGRNYRFGLLNSLGVQGHCLRHRAGWKIDFDHPVRRVYGAAVLGGDDLNVPTQSGAQELLLDRFLARSRPGLDTFRVRAFRA